MVATLGTALPSAELCRRNGWGPGTVLVAPPAHEAGAELRLQLTAVGDALVLAREWEAAPGEWPGRLAAENVWDLSHRAWELSQD